MAFDDSLLLFVFFILISAIMVLHSPVRMGKLSCSSNILCKCMYIFMYIVGIEKRYLFSLLILNKLLFHLRFFVIKKGLRKAFFCTLYYCMSNNF
jgi:hypothetical protein